MMDRRFEMLLSDKTKYTVNAEKMNNLEKLTTITQLVTTKAATSRVFSPYCMYLDVLTYYHRELLNMQCLLVQILTVEHCLKQNCVTVKEIFDYCEKHKILALKEIKKLIITAIEKGYLEERKK